VWFLDNVSVEVVLSAFDMPDITRVRVLAALSTEGISTFQQLREQLCLPSDTTIYCPEQLLALLRESYRGASC